jgi:hypothetical protein
VKITFALIVATLSSVIANSNILLSPPTITSVK